MKTCLFVPNGRIILITKSLLFQLHKVVFRFPRLLYRQIFGMQIHQINYSPNWILFALNSSLINTFSTINIQLLYILRSTFIYNFKLSFAKTHFLYFCNLAIACMNEQMKYHWWQLKVSDFNLTMEGWRCFWKIEMK